MGKMLFRVYEQDGSLPDLEQIAIKEEWAKGLIWCDMEGFALDEYGDLLLLDECGGVRYCPQNRFKVVFEESAQRTNTP